MIATPMRPSTQINARRLRADSAKYALAMMYVEFENVADPEDTVTPPSFSADDGVEYYSGLTGTRDYLRVPVVWNADLESTDAESYPDGNKAVAMAFPVEGTGENGLTFGAAANSKIVGGAIVATPEPSDASQDLLFLRFYLEDDEQFLHLADGQSILRIGLPFVL